MRYRTVRAGQVFVFDDLRQLMACASPARSGDYLAGIGAATAQQRMAARMCWPTRRSRSSCRRRWCRTKTTTSRG